MGWCGGTGGIRQAAATLLVAAAVAVTIVVAGAAPGVAAGEPDRGAAGQLLVLVNADRSAEGLPPLLPSVEATTVAESWSGHMVDINDLAHNDAWFSADMRRHVGAGVVGENVAMNVDIADAHRRLMASPGHRANILDPRFDQVGIGAIQGPTGSWWITEDFLEVKDVVAAATAPVRPDPAPAPASAPVVVRVRAPAPPVTAAAEPVTPPPAETSTTVAPPPDGGAVEGVDVVGGELASAVSPAAPRPRAVPPGTGRSPATPLALMVVAVLVAIVFESTNVIRLLRLRQ